MVGCPPPGTAGHTTLFTRGLLYFKPTFFFPIKVTRRSSYRLFFGGLVLSSGWLASYVGQSEVCLHQQHYSVVWFRCCRSVLSIDVRLRLILPAFLFFGYTVTRGLCISTLPFSPLQGTMAVVLTLCLHGQLPRIVCAGEGEAWEQGVCLHPAIFSKKEKNNLFWCAEWVQKVRITPLQPHHLSYFFPPQCAKKRSKSLFLCFL